MKIEYFILKMIKENNLDSAKVVENLHEALFGCLYLNEVMIDGSKKVYYEIRDGIIYIQGIICFDNILAYYNFLDTADQNKYNSLYLLAKEKKRDM